MGTRREIEGGDDPFQAGQTVDGRYRILRRLNAGGVGVVYEAEHSFTGLKVALKALHNRAGDHPERMQAEARTLAEMRHPNIVQITDGGVTDGVVWFTMELLQGSSLRELLNKEGALDVERALRVGIQVAEGVASAHEQGVIHRDLKPENVFVLRDASVKVLDFGTSKITNKLGRSGALKTTDRFRLIGTQAYMPPERLKAERTDGRADVYALGHILYEMIAGRHCWSDGPGPLDLPEAIELGMRQIYAPPAPLAEHVPGLPAVVDRMVLRALSKDPRHRQQSMRELAAELQAALATCSSAPRFQRPTAPKAVASPRERESFATTTEETAVPFSAPEHPKAGGRSATAIDAALMRGAVRFASSSPQATDVEQGLRAIAAAAGDSMICRDLSLASAECDDRSRAPLRAAVARIGTEREESRERLIGRLQALLAQRTRAGNANRSPSPRTDIALGAALLLEPGTRSDAAESALFKLGAADADVQSFALSILVAFGRTPVAMHPAPRGALLALLLGAAEDSELARSELAAFVLSAASLQDSEPPPPPEPREARSAMPVARSPSAAQTPTPSGIATPRPSPPTPPAAAPAPPTVRMGWVLAIAFVCASLVLVTGAALRARTSGSATSTRPSAAAPPAKQSAPPADPTTDERPPTPASAAVPSPPPPPSADVPTESRKAPAASGPPSAAVTPRPTPRSGAGAHKLPGSGL
ncbi:MAG: serine/threonine protein kinase [Polyangiaceae bacterium]|nr:serine/threonine protein kinase [Polyangiaceae bacterium]MCL4756373.1 serine/threonine protein kinase [Myxococcales bacterium]